MSEPRAQEQPSEALWTALRSFEVDRVTAEVTSALTEQSIESILLKGPTIAAWLYAHDRPRLYSDTDLLIRRSDWDRALAAVGEMGFRGALGPLDHPRMESGAGHSCKRERDGADVDLHFTLFGVTSSPERAWTLFREGAEEEVIGGTTVLVMERPARLLHISLHAVQHGGHRQAKPMIDLERALSVAPLDAWRRAGELAVEVGAVETFNAGLALLPIGSAVAADLGLSGKVSLQASLRLDSTPMAEGFEELAHADGLLNKIALVSREVIPTAEFMRWRHPLARRGRRGLIASYLWRLTWLARHAVPGFLTWRRARATAEPGEPIGR